MTFLDQPLSHWARRTSADTVREACAIHAFKRRMPLSEKVLYALAPVCVVVAILFNQYGA
jgi:hypothetical protein